MENLKNVLCEFNVFLYFVNHFNFFNRIEKAQTIAGSGTRSRNMISAGSTKTGNIEVKAEPKATPEEIKDKLEQQLKLQRAVHQQKRTNDKTPVTTPSNSQVIKLNANSNQQGMFYVIVSHFRDGAKAMFLPQNTQK